MSKRKVIFYIVFIFGAVLGSYMTFIEPFNIIVVERELVTDKWQGQKPLKIALVTDVHAIVPWMTAKRLEGIIQQVNDLNPDIILLLGDYVATHPFGLQIDPDEGVAPYKALKSPCGVYAVLGNHDFHNDAGWPEALRKTGLPVLENKSEKVECSGREFWVSGLEEFRWQHADVGKTLAQVTDDKPIILMTHNPDSFVNVPEMVALSVAGHTHGGQVRLPFIGAVAFIIPSQYGNRFVYGHVHEDGKDLIVSSGLGTTGLPIRLLMPPEIVMVTLRSE